MVCPVVEMEQMAYRHRGQLKKYIEKQFLVADKGVPVV
jgi:hypothetical protein